MSKKFVVAVVALTAIFGSLGVALYSKSANSAPAMLQVGEVPLPSAALYDHKDELRESIVRLVVRLAEQGLAATVNAVLFSSETGDARFAVAFITADDQKIALFFAYQEGSWVLLNDVFTEDGLPPSDRKAVRE